MHKSAIATLGLAALTTSLFGCGPEPMVPIDSVGAALTGVPAPHLVSSQFTTVMGVQRLWVLCDSNDVMVGFHNGNAQALCIDVRPTGLSVLGQQMDPPKGLGGHQVPFPGDSTGIAPYMHGCPQNYFVQGVGYDGQEEWLLCAQLKNSDGTVYSYSNSTVDGYGSSNNGTQSNSSPSTQFYFWTNPTMHVCPKYQDASGHWTVGSAMAGVHRGWNDLWCLR